MIDHPDTIRSTEWRDLALCREIGDFHLWFPGKGGTARPAKSVCGRCVVRDECLTEAMAEESQYGAMERHGIRGGLTPNERDDLARTNATREDAAA